MGKKIFSAALKLLLFPILFIGSCAGPMYMYSESPRLLLSSIDSDGAHSFYVAYMFESAAEEVSLGIAYQPLDRANTIRTTSISATNVNFHLTEGQHYYSFGPGEGSANVNVTTSNEEEAIVQVFVVGDTPWTSLSEYRVANNTIYPLRHAHSNGLFLIASVVLPLLLLIGTRRFLNLIDNIFGIRPEKNKP